MGRPHRRQGCGCGRAWRGLCAACPPRPRGATAVRRPDRFQWPVVQVVPHQADVCAHTVAHRSLCLTPGRSALPTKIRTPVTGVFRSSGADGSMLPRIPSSEGPTGACQATASPSRTPRPPCPQTPGRGGSRAHSAQTTRRARAKLSTGRSDVTTDLAHARRHSHAPVNDAGRFAMF